MLNRETYNPVRTISRKGNFLVGLLRLLFGLRHLLGGTDWRSVWPQHHEDPLYMKKRNLLYFAHKYYYKIIESTDEPYNAVAHFRNQKNYLPFPEIDNPLHSITLSAAGDLMPYYCIDKQTCSNLWDECGDFFFQADIVTANLETPLYEQKPVCHVPEVMLSNMYFNANAEMFDIFSGNGKFKGYDVLSVANNHSLDQGEDGLLSTLQFLKNRQIAYCGASPSADKVNDFPIIEKNGIKVAFLAATFSLNAETLPEGSDFLVNHLQLNQSLPDISLIVSQAKLAREYGADLIVAHLHMGCAYQPFPSQHTVENMHTICQQTGIDIVLGGHPHNAQPLEFFPVLDPFSGKPKNSFIIYSMGDFIAYDIFKWCHLPVMLKFKIDKNEHSTAITGIELKMAYMHSHIKNSKVVSLKLRDYVALCNRETELDDESKKEFAELKQFANQYLLPGNFEKYLV